MSETAAAMAASRSLPHASISFPLLGDFMINPQNYIQIGSMKIYWYAIIIATGVFLAVLYAVKRAPQFGIAEDNIYDMVIVCIPTAVVCARIYYVVSEWEQYKDNFVDVFKIWEGGLGMYGVIFGGILAVFLYSRYKKIPFGTLMDVDSFGLLIGQIIGRWGNFMNREAFGYQTDLPWKMGLTQSGTTIYVHPTFLYESLWNLAGFLIIHFYSKKHRRYDGQILAMYLTWYGFGRMLVEGLRTDSLYILGTDIRKSQLVALLTFVCGLIFLLWNRFKVKHDPRDLYVNRRAALAAEAAEAGEETAAEQAETVCTENADKENDNKNI